MVSLADLAAFPPERFADLVFDFHPSARLLRFAHPAASIWAGHQGDGEPRPPEVWGPEEALIVRPEADVSCAACRPGATPSRRRSNLARRSPKPRRRSRKPARTSAYI